MNIQMNPSFFELQQFSCGYDSFGLSPISFSLPGGIFAGIIGPNGSGKTTLFRGITGVLPKRTGNVFLNGQVFHSLSLKERAQRVAIVSQTIDAGPVSVEDYVLMGRLPYARKFRFFETAKDIELAHHYMKQTEIFTRRDQLMSELSGGEQQRASIARALTQEPDLLLLDEPTSHLDITHQVRILDLLSRLNQEMGLTILMVIHDLNLAAEYCNRLFFFNRGELINQGTPEEVLTYQNIEKVYHVPVITRKNPYSGSPVIFLVSNRMMQRMNRNS